MAAIDYYQDSSQHGNYQYITLEEIINNYLMSRDADDYSATVPRFKILYQAMRGLREFYYDVLNEVRAIEIELSPALSITLPPDYVNYVRVSWVDEQGQLHPMSVDNRMSIAQEYLQDHQYNLLFDNQGCVMIGDSRDIDSSSSDSSEDSSAVRNYSVCSSGGFRPNQDMSKHYPNGKFRLDKTGGAIYFDSTVKGRFIVLEYISDGLFTGCEGRPESEIRIHKFAEGAINDFIHYELIKNRRNVPYNEKIRARKEYFNSRRLAKMRINTVRREEFIQAFKAQSKWIK